MTMIWQRNLAAQRSGVPPMEIDDGWEWYVTHDYQSFTSRYPNGMPLPFWPHFKKWYDEKRNEADYKIISKPCDPSAPTDPSSFVVEGKRYCIEAVKKK